MDWKRNLRIGRSRDAWLIGAVSISVWLAFLAYIARLSDVTHDAFHEMALARAWIQTGEFPRDDVFAFTPTVSPTVHHEWGTGLFLYWVAGIGPMGVDGMAVCRVILTALLGLLVYRVARNAGAHPLMIGLCAPIAFPLAWVGFGTLRAQLFSLVFLAMQMLLLQSDWYRRRTWVLGWMVLYIVWLNMHAGVIVGIGLLGCHFFERWMDPWWKSGISRESIREHRHRFWRDYWHHIAILTFLPLGLMCNPWGWDYPVYLLHAIRMPRPTIYEWLPLWEGYQPEISLPAFGLMCLLMGYAIKNRRLERMRGWLFTCLAAYMALKHMRHGSLFAIVWMAWMPAWLTPTPLGHRMIDWMTQRRQYAIAIAMSLSVAFGAYAFVHRIWRANMPTRLEQGAMVYPVGAVDYLRASRFHGRMMTPFSVGAYISWECYPDILISIDGRYEVAFRSDVLPKHDRFYGAEPGWREVLDEFDADAILVRRDAPVLSKLGNPEFDTTHYRIAYVDDSYAIFVQDSLSVRSSGLNSSSLRH